ncbi:uncharacterized protein [Apteryx mantelli]|uniref:Uncharacterized protein isoform X4 n=1 Tax=Apteryx mantelli TaxID=2696672 RepID=A0ABM4E365_9AVES
MALTAPPARGALFSAAASLLLLGAAAGSSHFLDKTQLTKKGDAHLKQEGIIRMHNSVALSEPMKITSIPDVPQTPHQILGKENSTDSEGLVLTEGYLEIYNIHASDTGSYTCKVTYVHNDKHMMTEVRFMIYVFPFALAFTDPCESSDCENSFNCIKKVHPHPSFSAEYNGVLESVFKTLEINFTLKL